MAHVQFDWITVTCIVVDVGLNWFILLHLSGFENVSKWEIQVTHLYDVRLLYSPGGVMERSALCGSEVMETEQNPLPYNFKVL